eukprot:scaffold26885_cov112-Isochrysis_galbana.AAC.5
MNPFTGSADACMSARPAPGPGLCIDRRTAGPLRTGQPRLQLCSPSDGGVPIRLRCTRRRPQLRRLLCRRRCPRARLGPHTGGPDHIGTQLPQPLGLHHPLRSLRVGLCRCQHRARLSVIQSVGRPRRAAQALVRIRQSRLEPPAAAERIALRCKCRLPPALQQTLQRRNLPQHHLHLHRGTSRQLPMCRLLAPALSLHRPQLHLQPTDPPGRLCRLSHHLSRLPTPHLPNFGLSRHPLAVRPSLRRSHQLTRLRLLARRPLRRGRLPLRRGRHPLRLPFGSQLAKLRLQRTCATFRQQARGLVCTNLFLRGRKGRGYEGMRASS